MIFMTNNVEQSTRVLDVKGLQIALGIGKDTAYSLMRSQAFPSMRLGRRYVVRKEAFEAWLKRNEGKNYVL